MCNVPSERILREMRLQSNLLLLSGSRPALVRLIEGRRGNDRSELAQDLGMVLIEMALDLCVGDQLGEIA
jgi:hypothetical protein